MYHPIMSASQPRRLLTNASPTICTITKLRNTHVIPHAVHRTPRHQPSYGTRSSRSSIVIQWNIGETQSPQLALAYRPGIPTARSRKPQTGRGAHSHYVARQDTDAWSTSGHKVTHDPQARATSGRGQLPVDLPACEGRDQGRAKVTCRHCRFAASKRPCTRPDFAALAPVAAGDTSCHLWRAATMASCTAE